MTEHYYAVEVPGPKERKSQIIKAAVVNIIDGCLVFYQNELEPPVGIGLVPSLIIAAFAPGRWITCKLGVMKSPDTVKPPEAAPDAA